MQKKPRQMTDKIHETIYISEIEYRMMSTPYFYRLHDVYQSSTVYMTFPSNRTKRYEHSLGTMELAGQMLYSAITNASTDDRKAFMQDLDAQFDKVVAAINERNFNDPLYSKYEDQLGKLLQHSLNKSRILTKLKNVSRINVLSDYALDKQSICFLDLVQEEDGQSNNKAINTIQLYSFLYRCTLEALRVAALFHDIGHPPFSHILEKILEDLYEKICEDDKKHEDIDVDKNKSEELRKCLEKYMDRSYKPKLLLQSSGSEIDEPALHERIGLNMLHKAYSGVMRDFVSEWKNNVNDASKISALFLVTVIEFTFGILEEKAPIFETLHRIIDGPVDVDRMDYVVRDSQNSGVEWGKIPYQRMISSAKFMKPEKQGVVENRFVVAFPEKVSSEIDDLLVNRYKIFQRINFHHKSTRTSELLQRSVKFLAEDYLSHVNGEEIAPEIKDLWCSLGPAFGNIEVENKVGKWTDSWLISVLSNALITLSDSEKLDDLKEKRTDLENNQIDVLYSMLEEIILNKKRYFPLLKRQRDAIRLRNMIQEKAGINDNYLDALSEETNSKLLKETDEAAKSAIEGLYRINMLRTQILGKADLRFLNIFFRSEKTKTCDDMIEEVLMKAENNKRINAHFLHPNSGHMKLGILDSSGIYLYRNKSTNCYEYNAHITLKPQLIAQRAGYLWLYVYVGMIGKTEEEIEIIIEELTDEVAENIAQSLKRSLEELFPNSAVTNA